MEDQNQELVNLRDAVSSLRSAVTRMTQREKRRRRLRGLALLVLLLPAVVYAAQVTLPNVFANGTIADANDVNANFDTLVAESNGQDERLNALEATPAFSLADCALTDYVNDWNATMNANCPVGKVMHGLFSIHDNSVEDRRFRFRCCSIVEN